MTTDQIHLPRFEEVPLGAHGHAPAIYATSLQVTRVTLMAKLTLTLPASGRAD